MRSLLGVFVVISASLAACQDDAVEQMELDGGGVDAVLSSDTDERDEPSASDVVLADVSQDAVVETAETPEVALPTIGEQLEAEIFGGDDARCRPDEQWVQRVAGRYPEGSELTRVTVHCLYPGEFYGAEISVRIPGVVLPDRRGVRSDGVQSQQTELYRNYLDTWDDAFAARTWEYLAAMDAPDFDDSIELSFLIDYSSGCESIDDYEAQLNEIDSSAQTDFMGLYYVNASYRDMELAAIPEHPCSININRGRPIEPNPQQEKVVGYSYYGAGEA